MQQSSYFYTLAILKQKDIDKKCLTFQTGILTKHIFEMVSKQSKPGTYFNSKYRPQDSGYNTLHIHMEDSNYT